MHRIVAMLLVAAGAVTTRTNAAAQVGAAAPGPEHARAWEQIVAAEDARARTPARLRAIMDGARSADAMLSAVGVRALGRLQRVDLVDSILPFLSHAHPHVRAQAALAVARAHEGSVPEPRVRDALAAALRTERDPVAGGAFAEALGLLRHADAAATRATAAILIGTPSRVSDNRLAAESSHALPLGIARGLFFLSRQPPAVRQGLDTARAALARMATTRPRPGDDSEAAIRIRTVAAQAIALAGPGDTAVAYTLLSDPAPMVRREAVAIANTVRDTGALRRVNAAALADTHWMVRHDAVRQYAARILRDGPCAKLLPYARAAGAATGGPEQHVRNAAIELMGGPCTPDALTLAFLDSTAGALRRSPPHAWHAPARAIIALAARDARAARPRLADFAVHENQFVRTYAATAAGLTRDTAALIALSNDRSPNVRTAAVQALSRILGRAADSIYITQLALDDSQLLMAAAAALDSTRSPSALTKALDALDRVTALRSETSRDGRAALLKLVGTLRGTVTDAPVHRVIPYLKDLDATIASQAADILEEWTGTRPEPAPQPLDESVARPTYAEAVDISQSTYTIEMADGSVYEVKLFPFDAPVNATRFARQVRDGWFDGLTLHRVEPSFVVQGGSPNANEYAGAKLFSRDELGRSNWRGTIGLSTRGHDTGDAQLYINSIDNVRLDPSYTVFGQLTNRASAADALLEGAVIRKITIRR